MSSSIQTNHIRAPNPPPYKRQHAHLEQPRPRRTNPLAWLTAVICAVLWTLITLGGLAVLIVYLVFRPKTPRLDISTATLNAVYVDDGNLLNLDITILVNFTNPNHKVDVSYRGITLDLYYNSTMIGTNGIDSFDERRMTSDIRDVHLVASEVELPTVVADWLRNRVISSGSVALGVNGRFLAKSRFGNLVTVSYWLHTRCSIEVAAPPGGVLLTSQCRTKR